MIRYVKSIISGRTIFGKMFKKGDSVILIKYTTIYDNDKKIYLLPEDILQMSQIITKEPEDMKEDEYYLIRNAFKVIYKGIKETVNQKGMPGSGMFYGKGESYNKEDAHLDIKVGRLCNIIIDSKEVDVMKYKSRWGYRSRTHYRIPLSDPKLFEKVAVKVRNLLLRQ
jgi:hypothetical protein